MSDFQHILDLQSEIHASHERGEPYDSKKYNRLLALIEEPRWHLFYGYNHIQIPKFKTQRGGGFSFLNHIGFPLSQDLWTDLVLRMKIEYIQIYRPTDCQPMSATSTNGVLIFLHENGNVKDIYYTPSR
jgi:hypothetical protein